MILKATLSFLTRYYDIFRIILYYLNAKFKIFKQTLKNLTVNDELKTIILELIQGTISIIVEDALFHNIKLKFNQILTGLFY